MFLDLDNWGGGSEWLPISQAPLGAKFECELRAANGKVYRGVIFGSRTQYRMPFGKTDDEPLTHFRV